MFFQLAWRNIWRNPRRTAVIVTAVVIGIWSMIFIGSLMKGVNDQLIRTNISTLTGSLQIHQKGFRDDPVIDHRMTDPEAAVAALTKHLPEGSKWTGRIRVNAVAGNARHSSGITLAGIDPEKEAQVSFIGKAALEGEFLKADDPHGIVIGRALAEKFETRLGRKLVLMSQAADGEMASKAFRIVGVYRAEMEATEKRYAFVTLAGARKMLKLGNELCEISALLPDGADPEAVTAAIGEDLPASLEVRSWKTLLPIVTAYAEMNSGFTWMWFLVVFIAMGFGIVNTLLMAVFERMREFGLMKALGMTPRRITAGVLAESAFLLILGMVVGNLLSLASIFALLKTGIDLSSFAAGMEYAGLPRIIYPALDPHQMLQANLVVLILGLVVSLYPALKAARFTPVEAMSRQ